jgi:Mrp family chromosome partitioning ATPase
MLDALKRAEDARAETDEQSAGTPMLGSTAEAEASADTEEVPFIEVGPHKSMEASPSVLACSPVVSPFSPRNEPQPAPRNEPLLGVPTPRSVQFRALPGRMETRCRFSPELVAYHAPDQAAARQYREVLDAVLSTSTAGERASALLFTSASPGTGNTTTLLNVAITAARRERWRVVVVDANGRPPNVSERLGLPAAPGLREVLAGMVSLEDVVRPTDQANLFALTAGLPASPPRDGAGGLRFVAETMRSLLRQLRQRFHLVFVDGPCWDGRPDAMALGVACDAVYLVVAEQESESPRTDELLQLLRQQGARLAGCILVANSSR